MPGGVALAILIVAVTSLGVASAEEMREVCIDLKPGYHDPAVSVRLKPTNRLQRSPDASLRVALEKYDVN